MHTANIENYIKERPLSLVWVILCLPVMTYETFFGHEGILEGILIQMDVDRFDV